MDESNIIPFPVPKVPLTEEETVEYDALKQKVEKASTLREIKHVKKEVKAFLEKVNNRNEKR